MSCHRNSFGEPCGEENCVCFSDHDCHMSPEDGCACQKSGLEQLADAIDGIRKDLKDLGLI